MTSKNLFFFSCLLVIFFTFPTGVFAQTPNNFDTTVSPTFLDLTAKPGTTVNQTIRLRNNTNTTITVDAKIQIMGGDEQGELTIKDTKEAHLMWASTKENKISLPPREWINVPIEIKIPDTAAYGYYWAVSFTTEDAGENPTTGAALNASIVVPLLLSVDKDGAKTEGKLLNFKTETFYYEYPPITFINEFQNTGNVHIKPQGNIFIKDFLGRDIATLSINETQGSILPGLKRTFETTWNDGFVTYEPKIVNDQPVMDENGKPKLEMKIHFQKLLDLRIGKYTATSLILVSGEQKDFTYEKTTSFFVFPWKIVLVLIAILAFVGVGLFTTGRSIIRKISGFFRKNK